MRDYYDLGAYSRPVTTDSSDAQVWFDRGLMWRYAFNHEESVRCFRHAVEHDPGCALAHWGIAYATGPYYNKPWEDFTDEDQRETLAAARRAIEDALALVHRATPVERTLIAALERRYQSDHVSDRRRLSAWNDDYAAAMREAHVSFPDDLDVAVLFAEALMDRTPWQLWDLESGEPAEGADTIEAVGVLERALQQAEGRGEPHPGALHMYIHVMEMSPTPELALPAADAMRDLAPDAGHFRHMPSHIDILRGDYHAALIANERAIEADRKYLEHRGPFNFYTLSRCHDVHFKVYAAMFLGQYQPALDAANELVATIPEELLRTETPPMADWLEGFVPINVHVLVRFGRWRELIEEPLPDDRQLYSVTTAMRHYGKGIAHATLGEIAEAEDEQRRFLDARRRVPPTRRLFNNTYEDILAVAAAMLQGEIDYRKGDHGSAFAHLRTAVTLDDGLPYDEPWGWMQPARHALGALLLEQGHVEEAAQVYREDLGLDGDISRAHQHPNNVWSLHGYTECLHRLGEHDEAAAVQSRLDLAMGMADSNIQASCFCRVGAVG